MRFNTLRCRLPAWPTRNRMARVPRISLPHEPFANSCHPEQGAPGAESKDPPKLGETQGSAAISQPAGDPSTRSSNSLARDDRVFARGSPSAMQWRELTSGTSGQWCNGERGTCRHLPLWHLPLTFATTRSHEGWQPCRYTRGRS
jgi:hypothetical protein